MRHGGAVSSSCHPHHRADLAFSVGVAALQQGEQVLRPSVRARAVHRCGTSLAGAERARRGGRGSAKGGERRVPDAGAPADDNRGRSAAGVVGGRIPATGSCPILGVSQRRSKTRPRASVSSSCSSVPSCETSGSLPASWICCRRAYPSSERQSSRWAEKIRSRVMMRGRAAG